MKAQRVFSRVMDLIDKEQLRVARTLLDSCEKKKYHADSVQYFRTYSCLRGGELRQAKKNWKKLNRNYPLYGDKYYLKGLIDFSDARYAGSIDAFTKHLEHRPGHEKALYNRALAYGLLDDFPSAIRDLDTLIKKGHAGATVFYSRAYWCEFLEKYDEAITAYTKVIELEPKHFDAYLGLAYAYRKLNENDKACGVIGRAIAEGSQAAAELRENYCP